MRWRGARRRRLLAWLVKGPSGLLVGGPAHKASACIACRLRVPGATARVLLPLCRRQEHPRSHGCLQHLLQCLLVQLVVMLLLLLLLLLLAV